MKEVNYSGKGLEVPCCQSTFKDKPGMSLYQFTLPPVTVQDIVPPRRKKNGHTPDNLRGKCPMIVPVFFTVTVQIYRPWTLCGSYTLALLQQLPFTSLCIHVGRKCNNLLLTPPR